MGTVREILQTHGRGFNIELQSNWQKLKLQAPKISFGESENVETEDQAKSLLEKIQHKMAGAKVEITSESLVSEFCEEGKLSTIYR